MGMLTVRGIRHLADFGSPTVLTIGNFDGLHLGHRRIISRLVQLSSELRVPSVVMTFDPHPRQVLSPSQPVQRLFARSDLEHELNLMGVDVLLIEPFSRELSQLDPEVFFADYIQRPFCPRVMIEGHDFSFGAHRKGTVQTLDHLLKATGGNLEIVPAEILDGVVVSSTRIRQSLADGNVRIANKMLQRRYYIEGVVERGDGRGHQIGFPTANLNSRTEFIPRTGVYAGYAVIRGKRNPAVQNIGVNPTFISGQGLPVKLETHLLDFTGDLYGETLRFEYVEFIRSERKFSGVAELTGQIQKDILKTREILGND
jgi:riboflavin kinase/FMN adenylyltransferase